MVDEAVRYAHLTGSSTAISRSTAAKLHRVTVNDPGAVSLTVYEAATAAGSVVAVLDCNNAGTFEYGVTLSGLTVVLGGTADVTVVYQ